MKAQFFCFYMISKAIVYGIVICTKPLYAHRYLMQTHTLTTNIVSQVGHSVETNWFGFELKLLCGDGVTQKSAYLEFPKGMVLATSIGGGGFLRYGFRSTFQEEQSDNSVFCVSAVNLERVSLGREKKCVSRLGLALVPSTVKMKCLPDTATSDSTGNIWYRTLSKIGQPIYRQELFMPDSDQLENLHSIETYWNYVVFLSEDGKYTVLLRTFLLSPDQPYSQRREERIFVLDGNLEECLQGKGNMMRQGDVSIRSYMEDLRMVDPQLGKLLTDKRDECFLCFCIRMQERELYRNVRLGTFAQMLPRLKKFTVRN